MRQRASHTLTPAAKSIEVAPSSDTQQEIAAMMDVRIVDGGAERAACKLMDS